MAAILGGLIPDVSGEGRHGQVTLDTWVDRLIMALTVWLPLLVSGTLFLGDFIGEQQGVICYPPSSNFSTSQANYVNAFCKENLDWERRALLMFPNAVLFFALVMYVPHLVWKIKFGTEIASQINFISKQINDIFRRLCDLTNLQDEDDLPEDQRKEMEKKKTDIRRQLKESFSVFISFLHRRISSEKLWKPQMGKIFILFLFALLCLTYLGWFSYTVSQNNDVFSCPAKIRLNFNESREHNLESVCEITGVQHLYPVSIILSMSFCMASLLMIFFFFHIKSSENNFLTKILENLTVISDTKTKGLQPGSSTTQKLQPGSSTSRENDVPANNMQKLIAIIQITNTSSDYTVIGCLCGENRHLIESPLKIISTGSHKIECFFAALFYHEQFLDSSPNQVMIKEIVDDLLDLEAFFRLAADQNSDADSGATGGAAAGRTHDVEADIHPQPPSPGSSSSFLRFHTEDETRPKGPTGEETVPLVYHRGSKNKSNPIEKETNF